MFLCASGPPKTAPCSPERITSSSPVTGCLSYSIPAQSIWWEKPNFRDSSMESFVPY